MSQNRFWRLHITFHDEGDRVEVRNAHSSGLPEDPQHIEKWVRERELKGKNVTVKAEHLKPDAADLAGHPFLGQKNEMLFNAAGQQVNENHEIVDDMPAVPDVAPPAPPPPDHAPQPVT